MEWYGRLRWSVTWIYGPLNLQLILLIWKVLSTIYGCILSNLTYSCSFFLQKHGPIKCPIKCPIKSLCT